MKDETKVPIGKTTVGGSVGALVGLVMAVLALLEGDRSEQTIGAIIGGLIFAASAIPTIAGRMLQAYGQIRKQAEDPSLVQAVANLVAESRDRLDDVNELTERVAELEAGRRVVAIEEDRT